MPRKSVEPMERVTVRLPVWLIEAIDKEAEARKRTFSDIVRLVLEQHAVSSKEKP